MLEERETPSAMTCVCHGLLPCDRAQWSRGPCAAVAASSHPRGGHGASPPRLQTETEEVLAHHLNVRRRHGDVLGGDVDVAETAFKAAAGVDRGRPSGVEHQVH